MYIYIYIYIYIYMYLYVYVFSITICVVWVRSPVSFISVFYHSFHHTAFVDTLSVTSFQHPAFTILQDIKAPPRWLAMRRSVAKVCRIREEMCRKRLEVSRYVEKMTLCVWPQTMENMKNPKIPKYPKHVNNRCFVIFSKLKTSFDILQNNEK